MDRSLHPKEHVCLSGHVSQTERVSDLFLSASFFPQGSAWARENCPTERYTASGECCRACNLGEGVVQPCGFNQTVCEPCLDRREAARSASCNTLEEKQAHGVFASVPLLGCGPSLSAQPGEPMTAVLPGTVRLQRVDLKFLGQKVDPVICSPLVDITGEGLADDSEKS
ncbi:Tumor necrosis factor receptor superfamily member 16 [Varanus komodoensis]|nr:Tumor necrosis factor receptor superfamily member 16 [Varanus komodoensis]